MKPGNKQIKDLKVYNKALNRTKLKAKQIFFK